MTIEFNDIAFVIGRTAVTWGEAALGAAAGLALMVLVILVIAWRGARARRAEARETLRRSAELEMRLVEMAGRLQSLAEGSAARDSHLARSLNERLDQVSHRMGQNIEVSTKRTTDSLGELNQRLAVIDRAQKNITELSSQVVGLQDILANKQSRGAFGQGRMEAIVMDGLPRDAYEFQATLSNGTRPDCLIRLPNVAGGIVIDAKFPLEAVTAFREARDPAEARPAAQRLRTDIAKHIGDIATRYLIPGETQDTAIMFVPSESIYADLHEFFDDVIQRAYRARIVIVSPNMLMLAIQTMQAILKDAQMREQAGLIQAEVGKLMIDVYRLRDRVLDLQKHFGQTAKDIDRILISTDKVTSRGRRIEQVELEEDGVEAVAVSDEGEERELLAGE
jgi:DNA recombination protein RmuC